MVRWANPKSENPIFVKTEFMKNTISYVLIAILFAICLKLYFDLGSVKRENEALKTEFEREKAKPAAAQEEEEVEVADYMFKLQWFSNKLYFAGKGNNPELVEFYLHEMEEAMEELSESEVVKNGVPIHKFIKSLRIGRIGTVRKENRRRPGHV